MRLSRPESRSDTSAVPSGRKTTSHGVCSPVAIVPATRGVNFGLATAVGVGVGMGVEEGVAVRVADGLGVRVGVSVSDALGLAVG
ncbi:hypothetical protein GCM10027569_59870 [Flindersiella endophytica]